MKRTTIGIVDYGIGNHASVRHTLRELGMRCRTSSDPTALDGCDLLVLPGVGAFRPAIEAVRAHKLDVYLRESVTRGKPLLGICLGMQLLGKGSHENGYTVGLGIMPGEVSQLPSPHWHIGWNSVEAVTADPMFAPSAGQSFFFNHSYAYAESQEFAVCRSSAGAQFTAAFRHCNVVGVQFHPEKSQLAGRELLRNIVHGLCNA